MKIFSYISLMRQIQTLASSQFSDLQEIFHIKFCLQASLKFKSLNQMVYCSQPSTAVLLYFIAQKEPRETAYFFIFEAI